MPGERVNRQPIQVGFYRKMIEMLEARGFSRKDGVTPLEYARQVIHSKGSAYKGVLYITHLYNRHRFGREQISPLEMDRIRSTLKNLKNLS